MGRTAINQQTNSTHTLNCSKVSQNPAVPIDENISEEKKYYNRQPTIVSNEVLDKNTRKLEPPPAPLFFWGNEDQDYRIHSKNLKMNEHDLTHCNLDERNVIAENENFLPYEKNVDFNDYCVTVPVVKSFKLDNVKQKVYFVNERSFAVLDNIPRELAFEGSPQLVFIEGMPQPIKLGFAGHKVKFEIDGQFHFIKFGTPAREVYIDDYPYEASFGGSPFIARMRNGKVYRIKICGPAPKVVVGATPANDLFKKFCLVNQEFLQSLDNEPYVNCSYFTEDPAAKLDVDMRINDGKFSSALFNFPRKKANELDLQRTHDCYSQQDEWNVPKNSFETYKDIKPNFITHRNYSEGYDWRRTLPLAEVQNSALNIPSTLQYKKFSAVPAFRPAYSTVNAPLQQCSRSLPPNNGPFSHPVNNRGNFLVGRRFSEVPAIPKLPPPPLPPFLGTIPSSSHKTALSKTKEFSQTSVSYCSSSPVQVPNVTVPVQATTSTLSTALNAKPVDLNLLLNQLKAAGIIGKNSGNSLPSPVTRDAAISFHYKKNKVDRIKNKEEPPKKDNEPQIVLESKCLKQYHRSVIDALHNGSQCANCGMRFNNNQSEQYKLHLAWHFRRIQDETVGAEKPLSRTLFYGINDWIKCEEFEDVSEKAPSYLELQAKAEESLDTLSEVVCSVADSGCKSETFNSANVVVPISSMFEEEKSKCEIDGKVEMMEDNEKTKKEEEVEKSVNNKEPEVELKELKCEVEQMDVQVESENSLDDKESEAIKTESIVESPLKSGNVKEDVEFHPPSPSFQVLPPVCKGKETSNLCTIM